MKIGIIGAMEQELEWLLSEVDITNEKTVANCKFYEGKMAEKDVVVLQSGIGKVNAALSTTILHEQFKPDYVINTGSAGGTDPSLNVGDIVIGRAILHHDADATAFGYDYGQIPQMPKIYESNERLADQATKVIESVDSAIQVVEGMIGTGDSFMSDEQRVMTVVEQIPEVKALEMEAAAIAQVCYQYQTPFLIIRSLSDIAGKESNVSFEQYLNQAAKNSAGLIVNMLKSM
ncbi:5'-methylthioadenosine/adenosylhomocysteine nucleosidase [Filobacillus milosensis]|uniref:5'-methylthioadenosine/S-adenosylhomocysteine nucleosidase n=1 Tax=Filobacillus milosensis TaxID=94137 RepID=A0A4Y8IWT8_9BACI|nr:5'-methylthioadenosine/adenosylhomocysteine nucleosidase [Filobacillus milosensis]TFB24885.1 5'-methylthioadenosine/adenosylhomocysteine nucleosidase [Filobacillus milosensis]